MESPTVRASRIVALSLVVGLFFTGPPVGMAIASRRPVRYEWDVLQELLFWVIWALLAPGVLGLARRWPLDARPFYSAAGKHAVVSVLLAALQTAITEALSAHQREVLVAITLNGVPIDVLAERLNTTRGALYKTLHDARKKLRRRLAADGFELAAGGRT